MEERGRWEKRLGQLIWLPGSEGKKKTVKLFCVQFHLGYFSLA